MPVPHDSLFKVGVHFTHDANDSTVTYVVQSTAKPTDLRYFSETFTGRAPNGPGMPLNAEIFDWSRDHTLPAWSVLDALVYETSRELALHRTELQLVETIRSAQAAGIDGQKLRKAFDACYALVDDPGFARAVSQLQPLLNTSEKCAAAYGLLNQWK